MPARSMPSPWGLAAAVCGMLAWMPWLAACSGAEGPRQQLPRTATPSAGAAPNATASNSVTAVPSATAAPTTHASATATAQPSATAAPAKQPARGPLNTFHEALAALKRGERKDHVRIMWLGDSHAQADFWTHEIRTGLQARYGAGGPGFIRIGYRDYRHSAAAVKVDGGWRMRPKRPSTIKSWGDGAFGLGGILHAGYSGARRARLKLIDPQLQGRKLNIELCYKFGLAYDEFRWLVGGKRKTFKASADTVGKVQYVRSAGAGLTTLEVAPANGRPDFCGVVVETDPGQGPGPGVVLDNLGINGARYATALAWNEQAWATAVKRRPPPELFIFEYGGNEASDLVSQPELYEKNAIALIKRAKAIRADASCLVIAPSDRADAEERIPPIVDAVKAAAAASGCAFWDTYGKMGGKGSLRKWRDEQKASPDGVHLKPNGYKVLGEWLLKDLLAKPPNP